MKTKRLLAELCDEANTRTSRNSKNDSDYFKYEVLYIFQHLSEERKLECISDAKYFIIYNVQGYIGCALDIITSVEGGYDEILSMLKKYPTRTENHWNDHLLMILVRKDYKPLAEEHKLIEEMFPFLGDAAQLWTLLWYAPYNKKYCLYHLCKILIDEGNKPSGFDKNRTGLSIVMYNFGSHIFNVFKKVDPELPTHLVDCVAKGGHDISFILKS